MDLPPPRGGPRTAPAPCRPRLHDGVRQGGTGHPDAADDRTCPTTGRSDRVGPGEYPFRPEPDPGFARAVTGHRRVPPGGARINGRTPGPATLFRHRLHLALPARP